jgi:hypothetical protein
VARDRDESAELRKVGSHGFTHRRRALAAGESLPPRQQFAAEMVALSELKRRRPKPQPSENEGRSGADEDDGEEDAV